MTNIKELQDIPCYSCIHNQVCNVSERFKETTVNTTHPYVIVKLDCTQYMDNISCNKLVDDREMIATKRLRHLLESKFIRTFDEVDIRTKEYKRNIHEADAIALKPIESR